MSNILLDTNAFLAMIDVGKPLPKKAYSMIEARNCLLSIATPWEMCIKHSLGKLRLTASIEEIMQNHDDILTVLPIEIKHIQQLSALPHHHRDPFDRIIIAQAIAENLPVVSSDEAFDAYDVERVWE
ncbi:MAG: type II toxin-antitoxin system VapC family toxin [Candidatus Kapabacteria bacterium]|jgi:PIN domain nuclease of toxin-antitoxin system|nr:type II toxin-antitoxin system VapC family toxin [Candidatus Kapabacteria bacterium]